MGLLVLECGRRSVRMSPALTVSEAEMETAFRIFGEAVATVAGEHGEVLFGSGDGRGCDARGGGRRLTRGACPGLVDGCWAPVPEALPELDAELGERSRLRARSGFPSATRRQPDVP